MIGGAEKESELKGSIALGGAKELGEAEGRRGGRKAEIQGDFGLSGRLDSKHLYGEQMAERGRMGVREEVERRTGTAREQRGRGRETEKEIGKQINQMRWKQLVCRWGRGLDPEEC